jgi:hypothetical protein
MNPRRAVLVLVVLGAFAGSADACSVPVFRYALERWRPDLYEAIVFHRGPLQGENKDLLKRLEKAGFANGGLAPVDITTVDLWKELAGEMKDLWQAQRSATAPWLVLRMTRHGQRPEQVWAAPFTAASVDLMLDSPVRRTIANAIRTGDSAIWVLLECGDKTRDDGAAKILNEQLRQLAKSLKLPVLRADNPEDRIERGPNMPELRLGFSMVRMSRSDPAEAPLVEMLMRVEEDLVKYADRPIAFPVFGRGRALYGLIGPGSKGEMSGINPETIEEACAFLIGPCGCEVKRLNPGSDLLISVDWTNCPERIAMPHLVGSSSGTGDPVIQPAVAPSQDDPERIPMPAPVEISKTSDGPVTPATDASGDTNLLNIFLMLVVGVVGTVAIALTMTRWRRV